MKTSHLTALRALEATLRTGNFRSAAAELGVTSAAVGQQVSKLEDYVGRKLFVRTTAGVEPTAQARRIAERLTAGFLSISEVLDGLKAKRPKNRLAISMSQTTAEKWLCPRLSKFYSLGVTGDFRIDTMDRFVNLYTDDFDLAIRFGPAPPDDHDDVHLFNEYVLPVCTPAFAKEHALGRDNLDLSNIPVLHMYEWTVDPDWLDWEEWGKRYGIESVDSKRGLRYSEMSFGLQAAISGNGLILSGFTEAHIALMDGRLVAPFGPKFVTKTSFAYRLVCARGHHKSNLQQTFETWILGEAELFRTKMEEMGLA